MNVKSATLNAVWLFLCALSCFLICSNPSSSWDIFYHLTVGRDILATGSLHGVDVYSYTSSNSPAENWMWGFGILAEIYKRIFGLENFHIFIGILGAAGCIFIYLTGRLHRLHPMISTAVSILFAFAVHFRMLPRPHLASLVMACAMLLVFEKNRHRPNYLNALISLLILSIWSTLHPGSIYGILIALCYVGELVLTTLFSKTFNYQKPVRHYVKTSVAMFGGALIGYVAMPLFSYRFGFVIEILTNKNHHVHWLQEYESLNLLEYPWLLTLLTTGLIFAIIDRKKPRPALIAWVLGFLPTTLMHGRTGIIMSVGLAGLSVFHAANLLERYEKRAKLFSSAVIPVACAIAFISLALWQNTAAFSRKPLTPTDYSKFPHKAVKFADELKLSGPMLNSYHFGNYLLYNFDPRRKVFVDAREWPYRNLFDELRTADPTKVFDKYEISWAIVDPAELVHTKQYFYYGKLLRDTSRWRTVYFDANAVIIVRRDGPDGEIAKEYGFDLIRPWLSGFDYLKQYLGNPNAISAMNLEVEKSRRQCPGVVQMMWEASFYKLTGRTDEAISLLEKAHRVHPDKTAVMSKLGSALLLKGEIGPAVDILRKARRAKPNDKTIANNLATAYLKAGDGKNAIRVLEKCTASNPEDQTLMFNYGLALQMHNKPHKAKAAWEKVIQINPDSPTASDARAQLKNLQ